MGNDALTDLVNKAYRAILHGKNDTSAKNVQIELSHELDRSSIKIGISILAKMLAEDFLKSRSINELRKGIAAKSEKGARAISIEELFKHPYYRLDIDLIWKVYTLISTVDSDYSKKLFSRPFRDTYSTLIINTAYELATRCIGIVYNNRSTESDIITFINQDSVNELKFELGIGGLLKEANIAIVNRTIIIAMLPFLSLYNEENVICAMTVSSYCDILRKYSKEECSHSDRIIFNKLISTLTAKLYHKDALIRMFSTDELNYNSSFASFLSLHPAVNDLRNNLDELQLYKSFKGSEVTDVVSCKLSDYKANIFTRFIYSSIDWVWRIRMGWNHELAVGSEKAWVYTNMHSGDLREFGTSFRYLKNRYLLETIGQTFIGYESTAYDAKCKRLRKVAKSLFNLVLIATNGDMQELCSAYVLKRFYTSLELDDTDLYAFINTLEIVMQETDLFTLHHLLTAFVFYSKYILKDYALDNIKVNSGITFNDIELWINYD